MTPPLIVGHYFDGFTLFAVDLAIFDRMIDELYL